MPVSSYPKQLTDAYWKKMESAIKVSNTGVGQTLRNAEKLYKAFEAKMNAQEKSGGDAAAAKQAANALATALETSEKAFAAVYAKLKGKGKTFEDDKEMKLLDRYQKAVDGLAHDAKEILSSRNLAEGIKRYNERAKMWAKFVSNP